MILFGKFLDKRKSGRHHFTGFANMNFVFPCFVSVSGAYRAIYKPAQLPCLEFPGRAAILEISRALFDHPALFLGIHLPENPGYHKQQLSFNVSRDRSPTLLITMYRFDGYAQKMRHLRLRFTKFFTKAHKRISFQNSSPNIFFPCQLSLRPF